MQNDSVQSDLERVKIEGELKICQAELDLKIKEFEAKIEADRKGYWVSWISTPLLLTIVGLLGTGVGALIQGYWNTQLERNKFEYTLVMKAFEASDNKHEVAITLDFLEDVGLLHNVKGSRLNDFAKNPDKIPTSLMQNKSKDLSSTALKVSEAKGILKKLGYYKGEINENFDNDFVEALKAFQENRFGKELGKLDDLTVSALIKAKD